MIEKMPLINVDKNLLTGFQERTQVPNINKRPAARLRQLKSAHVDKNIKRPCSRKAA